MPTATNQAQQVVDLEISERILDAARARLAVVRAEERACTGVAKTTLVDVARAAVLNWQAPENPTPHRKKRLATYDQIRAWARERGFDPGEGKPSRELREEYLIDKGLYTTTFRFTLPRASYSAARRLIHTGGQTVAGVVQAALEHFARTGTH